MAGERLLEAYPLTWPFTQRRTAPAARIGGSPFKATLFQASEDLRYELKLLRAEAIVVSSNLQLRRDGLPYSDAREPDDPGIAVYFDRRVDGVMRPFVVACDQYARVRYNMRAIGLSIAALRSIARYGASSMMEQAFTGFAALPPANRVEPWWEVLGVRADASADAVKEAFRSLAIKHHPDHGGSAAEFAKVTEAFQASQQQRTT